MKTFSTVYLMLGVLAIFLTLGIFLPTDTKPEIKPITVDTDHGPVFCVTVSNGLKEAGISCDWN